MNADKTANQDGYYTRCMEPACDFHFAPGFLIRVYRRSSAVEQDLEFNGHCN
jgi:hypothetical protein